MQTKESDIVYETGAYYIARVMIGTGRFKPKRPGYELRRNGVTHATLCGTYGDAYLERAKADADKRAFAETVNP